MAVTLLLTSCSGVPPAEVSETITHLGFLRGWPSAMAVVESVVAVYEEV
ncbi:carboxymuconolactone decarboxylase family protein [Nocardia callitridis]